VLVPGSGLDFFWTNNFSDHIDGGGDCAGEGPDDYPAPARPRRKPRGGCQATPGTGGLFSGALALMALCRRRRGRA
jgi:hypothetical protein